MNIFSKIGHAIGSGYNWADQHLAGGHLPGGTEPGAPDMSSLQVGGNAGNYGGPVTDTADAPKFSLNSGAPGPGTNGQNPANPWASYGSGAPPYVFDQTSGGGPGTTPGGGSSNSPWYEDPKNIIGIAGILAQVYGQHQNNQTAQGQLNIENQMNQQNYGLALQQQKDQEAQAKQLLEDNVAERMRRSAAIKQIIGSNDSAQQKLGVQQPPTGTGA